MYRLDVCRQPTQAQSQHTGGQIRQGLRREDNETGVVANQLQPPELLFG
ncbi:MAG: hypothetical protein OXD01_13550 [Gammaproteobacteria bacterium]|nr:hypothetical protein [Gammaproteobacteria bacterium]